MTTTTIKWRATVQRYPCDVCGAQPGEKCATFSGAMTYTPHAPRSALASSHQWVDPEACAHCHDDPPRGHTCPACGKEGPTW